MKRAAGRQITQDDFGDEESGGDDGAAATSGGGDSASHRASAEVMARRRVVKVKRGADGSWKGGRSGGARAGGGVGGGSASADAAAGGVGPAAAAAAAPSGDRQEGGKPKSSNSNPFAAVRLVAAESKAPSSSSAQENPGGQLEAAMNVAGNDKDNEPASGSPAKDEPATAAAAAASDPKGSVGNGGDEAPAPGVADKAATADVAAAAGSSGAPEAKGAQNGGSIGAGGEGPHFGAKAPAKASIFGATTGFTGFGSVGGFSGFATAPVATGGFGSAAGGAKSAPPSSLFGSSSGFGGFATAASSSSAAPSSGFVFGKSKVSEAETKKPEAAASGNGSEEVAASDPARGGDEASARLEMEGEDGEAAAARPAKAVAVQLPTDYERISGEESEKVLLEMRCRTYRWGPQLVASNPVAKAPPTLSVPPSAASGFSTDSTAASGAKAGESAPTDPEAAAGQPACTWHEAGIGPLRILCDPASNGLRLVQRRESAINGPATKVVWNVKLWRESTAHRPGDKHVRVTSILGGGQTVQVLCKCATVAQAAGLHELLDARIPDLKSAHHRPPAGKPEAVG